VSKTNRPGHDLAVALHAAGYAPDPRYITSMDIRLTASDGPVEILFKIIPGTDLAMIVTESVQGGQSTLVCPDGQEQAS
jgi:hypothetical protein